jgi:hypothetical protein
MSTCTLGLVRMSRKLPYLRLLYHRQWGDLLLRYTRAKLAFSVVPPLLHRHACSQLIESAKVHANLLVETCV